MEPQPTRCQLCVMKCIQLTENKRQTEYKCGARIKINKMSNPIVNKLNICVSTPSLFFRKNEKNRTRNLIL